MDGPRDLTEDERALLDHLVSPHRRGFDLLRAQAGQARVISATLRLIELSVPASAPAATDVEGRSGRVVTRAVTVSTDRWADTYLWLTDDGYLDQIEVMWPDGERDRLPRPDDLSEPMALGS